MACKIDKNPLVWLRTLGNRDQNPNVGCRSLENGYQNPKNGGLGSETGARKPETGAKKPETGHTKAGNRRRGRHSAPSPGGPRAQYIRSGPKGARGVLKGRGWSLCMFLSELLSFRLSSFCCLSVPSNKRLLPEDTLTGARGSPGLPGRSF